MVRQLVSVKKLSCLLACYLVAAVAHAQDGAARPAPPLNTALTSDSSPLRGPSFVPVDKFNASTLDGWHSLGKATWHAERGEITGNGRADGGWLIPGRSYQDVGFYAAIRCSEPCDTGVLLRMSRNANAFTGTLLSFKDGVLQAEAVTLDAGGVITARQKLRDAGGTIRFAPPASDPNAVLRRPRPVDAPAGITLPLVRHGSAFRPNDWNSLEVLLDSDILRAYLNDSSVGDPGTISVATADKADDYGPVALYVGKGTEVTFRDLGYRDIAMLETPADHVGSRFQVQRLTPYYYNWSAVAADFNHDGKLDIASGPYIYYGPGFTTKREIYPAHTVNPSDNYATFVQHAYDVDGDGWPDIVATNLGSSGATLYINPGTESRRWKQYKIIPSVQSEDSLMTDVDGDGKPELVYVAEGFIRYAKPDPLQPTQPWIVHTISEKGPWAAHGIGVGDVNGDGRMDIVGADGWWEQPKTNGASLWTYHPEAFGRWGRIGQGGATIGVYDVNGDGLNDVVTSLEAHGWGLAWFEQKRDASGKISFVRHMVMDDHNSINEGGVTFSELHGSAIADVDGDGIPDFIVGKRVWSHNDNNFDPDVYGPAVLYWYRTVRDVKAPGGARLVPELIDNSSGAGSDVLAIDLNGDGLMDIVTATKRGTYIYWGRAMPAPSTH